jgi:hypothetical protein
MPWWPKALGPNDRKCPFRSLFTAQNEGDFARLARLLVQPGERPLRPDSEEMVDRAVDAANKSVEGLDR